MTDDLHVQELTTLKAIAETLNQSNDLTYMLDTVLSGAKGYLLKDIEPEDLVRAIHNVYKGKVELHPDVAGQLMSQYAEPDQASPVKVIDGISELTAREQEVLKLIASGKSNRAIAEKLFISEKTVNRKTKGRLL